MCVWSHVRCISPLPRVPRRCAAQIEPDFYPKNKLLAAQAFAKLGRKDEAKEWLAACLRSPAKTPEDEETLEEAAKLKI